MISWQLTVDAGDPHTQADFWAAALGYDVEDNSELIDRVLTAGMATESDTLVHNGIRSWKTLKAIRGDGRRILFQQVPEPKSGKNRVHLDLNVGTDQMFAEVDRLTALGASRLREVQEPGTHHIVMQDPEGNEFCVQ
jgi:hypothetical protein